jgi:hypothetical protein
MWHVTKRETVCLRDIASSPSVRRSVIDKTIVERVEWIEWMEKKNGKVNTTLFTLRTCLELLVDKTWFSWRDFGFQPDDFNVVKTETRLKDE